jgi:hypothetical protein
LPNTFEILDPVTGTWGTAVSEPTLAWKANAAAACDASANCTYGISFAFNGTAQGAPGTGKVAGLSYRVTDVDGDSVTGLLNLLLTDSLTAGGGQVTFTSPPAASYAIPVSSLSNVIVPVSDTGVTLVVPADFTSLPGSITSPPPAGAVQFPLHGFVPPAPLSATPGQFIPYTPPSRTFLNCDVNGNDLAQGQPAPIVGPPCVGDSFWYYLVSGNGSTTSTNAAKVTVKIQASTSFSRSTTSRDVYKILSDTHNCNSAGCHNSTTTTDPTAASYRWGATTVTATYDSIKGLDTTYNVLGKDWTSSDAQGNPVATPAAAALYSNVCTASAHASSHFSLLTTGNAASCAILLQWLTEGAQND